ncbi:MAG: nucleotidyltransferase family protein [Planctomycetota bacterium]|nr:nucleotidyltransferase family protein [Planctomycetota bacterium]
MTLYEDKLNANLNWALREGSLHFEEKNAVHDTLRRITKRLTELQIPYAVVGGMAMFAHGFRRFTEDVDLLVTRESMDRIIEKLEGLGYVQPPRTTTKLRDTQSGVKIEFLISGGFPGEGKPMPVSFPDPVSVRVDIDGVSYVGLATLVQLKLASGTAAHRMKDLGDVQELIRTLKLPRDFAEQLDGFVRPKFIELWDAVQQAPADE